MSEELVEKCSEGARRQYFADAMQYQRGTLFPDNWKAITRACLSAIEAEGMVIVPRERLAELERAERNWDRAESAAYDE